MVVVGSGGANDLSLWWPSMVVLGVVIGGGASDSDRCF